MIKFEYLTTDDNNLTTDDKYSAADDNNLITDDEYLKTDDNNLIAECQKKNSKVIEKHNKIRKFDG